MDDMSFFDTVVGRFESDNRLSVRNILIVDREDYQYHHIKKTEKVTLLWNRQMVKEYLERGDYDVVYFYTLIPSRWELFKYIPKDKKIIWWAWGYDLYNRYYGLKPLLDIPLYKPLTVGLVRETGYLKQMVKIIVNCFLKPYYSFQRNSMLKRIDYFHPVFIDEYEMMRQQHEEFRAKVFFRPGSSIQNFSLSIKDPFGGILFGNSSTPTNNHLDVWEFIKGACKENYRVIIPLSYGDMSYGDKIQKVIEQEGNNVLILREMIEKKEYTEMIQSCSYAVFGMMRQQAMSNINHCMLYGIKVFLFKDSMNYKFLKSRGFEVFAIEDIDENSFHTPLTKEQQVRNIEALNDYVQYKNDIYETVVTDSFGKNRLLIC